MLGLLALGALGCDEGDASKSWSTFASCLAGDAAGSPLLSRIQKLRQIQLANSGPSAAWPKRCAPAADELYAALDKSGKTGLLKRKLRERLSCTDAKGSCKLPLDSSLLSISVELWESAQSAELKLEPVAGSANPEAAPLPIVDAKSWKSLSAKPMRISGPVLTRDGRAVLILKTDEGRVRPTGCEFEPGFAKVSCITGNASIPELPPQTLEAVNDPHGLYAAALTEKGMVAYDLKTGETSAVRGRTARLMRDGVVIERGAKEDVSAEKAAPPKPKAKPTQSEEGFIAVELSGGKASKDIKLPIQGSIGDPIALGNQILYLSPTDKGADLVAKSLTRGRLKDEGVLKGPFSGAFHTCQQGDDLAVATFGSRSGQMSAKPTGGEGKTQLAVTLFHGGAWSKPGEATLPFERATESELVCTKSGASLVWAQKGSGDGPTIGRIDCGGDGCKSSDTKLPGVDGSYFWAVGPLGDKVFLLYRSTFGETRLRMAPLAGLASAKDAIVFDSADFGGPTTGEPSIVLTDAAALLVFRGEQPVALRIGADGTASVVAP